MKQWPEFDSNGDLPIGIHQATIIEVMRHFGTNTLQRQIAARRLERIYNLAKGTGQLARFVVYGSFVTSKPDPNDVDVFMIMEDAFDFTQATGAAAIIFDYTAAQNAEGASVFWIRRAAAIGGERSYGILADQKGPNETRNSGDNKR